MPRTQTPKVNSVINHYTRARTLKSFPAQHPKVLPGMLTHDQARKTLRCNPIMNHYTRSRTLKSSPAQHPKVLPGMLTHDQARKTLR